MSDIGAAISSGSFPTLGMVIAPCSIRTMSEIACGVTASLLSRAADVVLKERRRLVLALRETPLHVGHLRNMTTLAEIGAVVAPIVPAFYNRPKTVDDIINHTCGRLLDLFGIDTGMVKRWKGGPAFCCLPRLWAGWSSMGLVRYFLFFSCSAMIGLATRKQSTPIGAPQ